MIGFIDGRVEFKDERTIMLSVGGIGYIVAVTTGLLSTTTEGVQMRLFTHLAVREDALDLYGFTEREELTLFKLLIGISGIGPKSAMNVLSLADIGTLGHAIASGDSAYLTKVSGIGKKLAQKIVLELKDKLGESNLGSGVANKETEALEALEALGYAPKDTRELVRTIGKECSTAEQIIRRALQQLGGRTNPNS